MRTDISIVIPCYNEEQNIRMGALDKVARYLDRQNLNWEVIIVDDGSTDASGSLIEKFIRENPRFRIIKNPHRGKAATVISGIGETNGEKIIFADLDQATPLYEMEKLIPWADKGYAVVIGSRKNRRLGAPFLRRLMGPGFMLVRNLFLGLGGIQDTQCGFKMFTADAARDIFRKLILYKAANNEISGARVTAGFDVEVLYVARRRGYKIKEVPVEWHYVETRRVSPWTDSIDALLDILKIRVNAWRHAYD